ncbi:MAG: hypothetical protein LBB98_10710, partial [Treponema sp.]|nr:hypothetical protein [Treponema sp.]
FIAYGAARPAVSFLLKQFGNRYGFSADYDSYSKLTGNISFICGMCLYTVLNYIGQRFIVFRRSDD